MATQPEAKFIRALALASEELIQMAAALRADSWQRSTNAGSEIRLLEDVVYFNWHVDVELITKQACSWWFEIQYANDVWIVERKVSRITKLGEEPILELPSKEFHSGAELAESMAALVSEFVATIRLVDLSKGELSA